MKVELLYISNLKVRMEFSYKKLGNLCISYEPVVLQPLKDLCSLFAFVSLCLACECVCVCTGVCYVCVSFCMCVFSTQKYVLNVKSQASQEIECKHGICLCT